jgi:hypothetical protein
MLSDKIIESYKKMANPIHKVASNTNPTIKMCAADFILSRYRIAVNIDSKNLYVEKSIMMAELYHTSTELRRLFGRNRVPSGHPRPSGVSGLDGQDGPRDCHVYFCTRQIISCDCHEIPGVILA